MTRELPLVVSVDDHVVEPPDLRITRGNALAMLGMADPALGADPAESAR
ncbi:hypothetical protein ACFZBU_12365 [Embleya sp. NPDC008237]